MKTELSTDSSAGCSPFTKPFPPPIGEKYKDIQCKLHLNLVRLRNNMIMIYLNVKFELQCWQALVQY